MQRLKRVWGQSITNKIAIILAVVFLIVTIGGYSGSWYFSWTGLADYTKPSELYVRGKTLWDWLQLLIIPAVLAGGAMWFSRAEREAEREIASDRLREAALQAYLDRMTDLLLEKDLRTSQADDEAQAVARARTVTTLRQLDTARRDILLGFLSQAGLIGSKEARVRLLSRANLSEADLRWANLVGADLSWSDLRWADLSWALLIGADLREASLYRANLIGANLRGADLRGASLGQTDLSGTRLNEIIYDDRTKWPENFTPPPDSIKE
jgi:hypothetical protein